MNKFAGVIFLHAITKASADELEATFLRLGVRTKAHEWQLQPLVVGCVKTVIEWNSSSDVAPELVTTLAGFGNIRFEVTQNQSTNQIGRRWSYSPGLGIFATAIDEAGNALVQENQLRHALYGSANDLLKTQAAMRRLLGTAWDDDLERFRAQSYEPERSWLIGLG